MTEKAKREKQLKAAHKRVTKTLDKQKKVAKALEEKRERQRLENEKRLHLERSRAAEEERLGLTKDSVELSKKIKVKINGKSTDAGKTAWITSVPAIDSSKINCRTLVMCKIGRQAVPKRIMVFEDCDNILKSIHEQV